MVATADAEASAATAAPAINLLDRLGARDMAAARWFDSLPSCGHGSGAAPSSLPLPPAQHGSAAASIHRMKPASAGRTFSSYACYADQHVNGGHAQQHQPRSQLLSLQLPNPRFEAGSVAGTPREATVADSSYGWASDTAAADGDSADGASPHGTAGTPRDYGGMAAAMFALQASGGESSDPLVKT